MTCRTTRLLLACGASFLLSACNGCEKKAASSEVSAQPTATVVAPSTAADPAPSGAPSAVAVKQAAPRLAASSGATAPSASASASATTSSVVIASAAPAASLPTPVKSGFADEIPKPCNDGFGRLGRVTFTDLGGGRVRVTGSKNASAMCSRIAPTQYSCDWVIDGKPTGTFVDKFDPAHKSVSGSIAKGQMFSCPPSSQS